MGCCCALQKVREGLTAAMRASRISCLSCRVRDHFVGPPLVILLPLQAGPRSAKEGLPKTIKSRGCSQPLGTSDFHCRKEESIGPHGEGGGVWERSSIERDHYIDAAGAKSKFC